MPIACSYTISTTIKIKQSCSFWKTGTWDTSSRSTQTQLHLQWLIAITVINYHCCGFLNAARNKWLSLWRSYKFQRLMFTITITIKMLPLPDGCLCERKKKRFIHLTLMKYEYFEERCERISFFTTFITDSAVVLWPCPHINLRFIKLHLIYVVTPH